jgi:hypothetical protein
LDIVAFLVVLVLLGAAVWIISAPLRREPEGAPTEDPAPGADVQQLEAARDAKYREIRDAEMDLRTGKLSEEDHRALEATLRAEAVEILRRLDAARNQAAGSGQSTS